MDYEGFMSTVREWAHIPGDEAERVACVTLQTLADRISSGEAEDLAERLPEQLRSCVEPHGPERFQVDEFLRRIQTRAGVDRAGAERDAVAVFAALWQAVGQEEFADMRSELPKDFDPLLDKAVAEGPPPLDTEAPGLPLMSFDAFIDRVAERAGVDRARAERATEAVLEVLAVRIAGGQVTDLETELPMQLRAPLERGRAETDGAARPLSADAFVAEVARREGVTRGEAAQHVRAVFATLREAVDEQEWHDTIAQLPGEYRPLMKTG
jgi:uncharacterized protein (DUF2267 family)